MLYLLHLGDNLKQNEAIIFVSVNRQPVLGFEMTLKFAWYFPFKFQVYSKIQQIKTRR